MVKYNPAKHTEGLFIHFFNVFSDGEIISQIKMTNIALAEIKELLKQQVKTHMRQTGLGFKGKKKKKKNPSMSDCCFRLKRSLS